MLPRFQPDRLNWPWTPEQMEALDNMLEELYGDVAGQNRGLNAVAKGDLIYGSATDTLSGLAIGAAGKVLRSDGTLPAWSTFTIPDTFALGDTLYASAANVLTARTIGAVGTVTRSDGSAPQYSTFTIPDTFAQGDLIYGSATNVLTALAKNTTATRYLSNTGASNNPAWAQVNLANGVTGALGATNGGTGQTTVATGDLLYGSATDTWSRLSAGLAGRYLRGGGAATAPAWSTVVLPNSLTQYQIVYAANTNQMDGQIALGTSGQVLISNGAGAVASFQTQNLLSASHADTAASAVTRGDLIIGNSTPAWDDLAVGTGVLAADGTDVTGWTQAPTLTTPSMTVPVVSTSINLTGGQITFPATQVASAGANVLDDYEEGTWTPVIGGAGGTSGQTYSTQYGEYTKIGHRVFVQFRAVLTGKGTITGEVQIQGLPFTSSAAVVDAVVPISWTNLNTAFVLVQGLQLASTTTLALRAATAATTSFTGTLATADILDTTILNGSWSYVI